MKRLFQLSSLLATLAIAASAATTAPAFPFTYYVHDTTGTSADTPFPAIYQFAATPLGSNSHVVIKAVNTSGTTAFMGSVLVATSTTGSLHDTNFTVTGLAGAFTIAAGGSFIFTVNFSPTTATGPITAYLQTSYQVQQTGCSFTSTDPSTQCPSGLNISATLTASATQPQLTLSYQSSSSITLLQPSGSPLNFGDVSTSGNAAITFVLSNQSSVPLSVPSITVPPPTTYTTSPFLLDLSQLPATLVAGASANFTITFEPGQIGLATSSLIVGSNSYPLQGEGIIVADIDALQVSYVDSTGVRGLPQAATPIAFGQVVAGSSSSQILTFTILNPSSSFNAVTIPALSVTGTGFTISAITGASVFPASLSAGSAISFKVTFSPTTSGNYSGTLTIGTRVFSLSGLSVNSPLPTFSLTVNPSPLTSQQLATVAIQFAAASSLNLVGTITMAFTPSVTGATDDPAIMFMATGGRTLSISVASGTQSATYNSQSALTFQSGTTAGTITFTVSFPNTATYTQSFTITPAVVQITSSSAVRSSPNLVVTLAGYDNTYSAGQLNFTFFDAAGAQISPVGVNASSSFRNLFFNNNQSGGAFSLQATFPVTGDVTKVASVAVAVSNSVGQANTTLTFQ